MQLVFQVCRPRPRVIFRPRADPYRFFGDDDRWQVRTTDDFLADVKDRPRFGTQSGPMLVVNGKLILSVEKSGNVKLFAKTLTLEGSDIKMKGSKVKLEAAGSLKDKSVKNKDIDALTEAELKKSVAASFTFPNGTSLEGQSFEVKLADGSTKSGKMGGGMGSVAEAKPGAAEISLPDLLKALES